MLFRAFVTKALFSATVVKSEIFSELNKAQANYQVIEFCVVASLSHRFVKFLMAPRVNISLVYHSKKH